MPKSEQVERWLTRLHSQGVRQTEPRRAIVEELLDWDRVFSPDEMVAHLQLGHPTIGRATVYRTLKKLESLGLLQRVQQPHECQFYRVCPDRPQHLLTCQRCGDSKPCSDEIVRNLADGFKQQNGFLLAPQALQFFGLCSQCQHSEPDVSSLGEA